MHVDHASHATIGIRAEVSLFVRVLMQVPRIEGWGGWFSAWFRAACSTGDFFFCCCCFGLFPNVVREFKKLQTNNKRKTHPAECELLPQWPL